MQVVTAKSTGTDNRSDPVARNFRISALREVVDI
jgi:hypothetical protein